MRHLPILFVSLALMSSACLSGEDSDQGATDGGGAVCTDGDTRACTCVGGASGEQSCVSSDWDACTCAVTCSDPGSHDGGDGTCVPVGTCASGYHDGGDGACVPDGTCASGYHDGGDGACILDGACASGYHDGGNGACVAEGSCATGYQLDPDGLCVSGNPCGEGVLLSTTSLDFGSVRVGTSSQLSFDLTNASSTDNCPILSLGLDGANAAYSLPGGEWQNVILAPGETRRVDVVFAPTEPGSVGGMISFTEGDYDGTVGLVGLNGRGSSSDLVFAPASVDFGAITTGCGATQTNVCAANQGQTTFTVASVEVDGSPDFAIVSPPSLPASLGPGQKLCFQLSYAPADVGDDQGTIHVGLAGGDVFTAPIVGSGADAPTRTQTFVQAAAGKADILWVVDNSASMYDEQTSLSNNAPAIVADLEQAGVDYHLGVVSTDVADAGALQTAGTSTHKIVDASLTDPAGTFGQNVMLGTAGSGTEEGLEQAYLALSAPAVSGANAGFLRSDATLAIVFVSDEDDSSPQTVDAYYAFFAGIHGAASFVASAIVTPEQGCSTGTAPGTRYIDLVSRTGGSLGSICQMDWLAPIHNIVSGLGLQTTFTLGATVDPASVAVSVTRPDGTSYVPAGWTFDASAGAVKFTGDVPQPGETIVVTYVEAC